MFPLSLNQRQLWALHKIQGSRSYHIPTVIKINGYLDEGALLESVRDVVSSHSILCSVIKDNSGEPYQEIAGTPDVEVVSGSGWSEDEISSFIDEHVNNPFDFSTGLIRICLLRSSPNRRYLVLNIHHIINDEHSTNILLSELWESFVAKAEHKQVQIARSQVQYTDYVLWQQESLKNGVLTKKLESWSRLLEGAERLNLPTDFPRPTVESTSGALLEFPLAKDVVQQLRKVCREEGVTHYVMMLSLFNVLLYRRSGQTDLCVGSPVVGRSEARWQNVVGFFSNTVVLRNDLSNNPSFRNLLKRVRLSTLHALDNQDVPFESVVTALGIERDTSRNPLCPVMFSYHKAADSQVLKIGDTSFEYVRSETTASKCDMIFHVVDNESDFRIGIEYCTDLFRKSTIITLKESYFSLIRSVIRDREANIGDIPLLSKEECDRIVVDFNRTSSPYPADVSLVELFRRKVSLHPGAVAVSCNGVDFTYRQIDRQSNALATYLNNKCAVRSGDFVGLKLERSELVIISMLAILKCSAIYVPLDVDYPDERLNIIIEDANIKTIIDNDLFKILGTRSAASVFFNCHEERSAYVMYTSGSTGIPKGVLVSQQAIVRLIFNSAFSFLGPDTITYQLAPVAFDASTFEIWAALLNGGRVVIASPSLSLDKKELHDNKVNTLWLSAGLFHEACNDLSIFEGIQYLIAGGDVINYQKVDEIISRFKDITFINGYGPTESTTFAITKNVTQKTDGAPSLNIIGKPIDNTTAYIFFENTFSVAPVGVPGELYLGGDGLAIGYLNQPELTSQKFIQHPFRKDMLLYKTGDFARYHDNGEIEFLGRKDDQVKIRGFRIELGEVTAAFLRIQQIRQCVVYPFTDALGHKSLVAFIITDGTIDGETAKMMLTGLLPAFMIPSQILLVPGFPLTINGKVDRAKLFELLHDTRSRSDNKLSFRKPSSPVEERIHEIWCEVLDLPVIDCNDNFFSIGGDSIKLIRLVSKMKNRFGIDVEFSKFYELPTIEKMAALITKRSTSPDSQRMANVEAELKKLKTAVLKSRGDATNIEDVYPLTNIQKGMIFSYLDNPGKGVYHDQMAYKIPAVDHNIFIQAFRLLVKKHPILRSGFDISSYEDAILIIYKEVDVRIELHHIEGLDKRTQLVHIYKYADSEKGKIFQFERAPLWRADLFNLGNDEMVYLFQFHHAILDGWSLASLNTELLDVVQKLQREPSFVPSQLKATYRMNIIREMIERDKSENIEFWENDLLDYKRLELFTEKEVSQQALKEYPPEFITTLRATAKRIGCSLHSLLFTAQLAALRLLTYDNDLTVGLVSQTRPMTEDGDKVLGCFLNTIPFRITLETERSNWHDLVRKVDAKLTTLKKTGSISLADIARITQERIQNANPFFDIMFNFVDFHVYDELETPNSVEDNQVFSINQTNTYLDLAVSLTGNIMIVYYAQSREFNCPLQLNDLVSSFESALNSICDEGNNTVHLEELLPPGTITKLHEFNNTFRPYPNHSSVPELITQQTVLHQDNIAIKDEEISLTYGELEHLSDCVAHAIINSRVPRQSIVPVIEDRGVDLVVIFLGLLKAGCIYLPLDKAIGPQRLMSILGDCKSELIIASDDEFVRAIGDERRIKVMSPETLLKSKVKPIALTQPDPEEIAYIIYTSGSTGKPKGVMIHHGGMLNHLYAKIHDLKIDSDSVVVQNAPATFDISIWQMLAPLVTGGQVVIYSNQLILSIPDFCDQLTKDKVSILEVVPSYLNILIEELEGMQGTYFRHLKFLVVTGETLHRSLVDRWFDNFEIPLVNAYGPTEASDDITHMILHDSVLVDGIVPIGKVVQNLNISILNNEMGLCPIGVVGEICVSGVGVGKGYINEELLTNKKFIFHSNAKDGLMYRTGDFGRWLSNGCIEFWGRIDDQVKIRGHRIELGEIESAIQSYSGINAAAVLVRESNDVKAIVAYIVSNQIFEKEKIEEYLRERLPQYMIPGYWISLDELPLSANGKVDKKQLALLVYREDLSIESYQPPRNKVEEDLTALWQRVIKKERIGINDNFFELGGDSITTIQIVSRARLMGYDVRPRNIFEHQTIANLSDYLVNTNAVASSSSGTKSNAGQSPEREKLSIDLERPIEISESRFRGFMDSVEANGLRRCDNITSVYRLSPAQEGMLFHTLYEPQSDAYLLQYVLDVPADLHMEIFERSWAHIIEQHSVLRTAFFGDELEVPVQCVYKNVHIPIEQVNLCGDDINKVIATDRWKGMDLKSAPLMRITVIRKGKEGCTLVWTFHHLLMDGWSMPVLLFELLSAYNSMINHHPLLPQRTDNYEEFIKYLKNRDRESESEFWHKYLGHVDQPTFLPFVRSNAQRNKGIGEPANLVVEINERTTLDIRKFVTRNRITTNTLLQGVWSYILSRYTRHTDVTFGVVVSGRPEDIAGTEQKIGLFMNTIPFAVTVDHDQKIVDWLLNIQIDQVKAREFQYTPLNESQKASKVKGDLFDSILVVLNFPFDPESTDNSSLKVDRLTVLEKTNYPLAINVSIGATIAIGFNYNSALLARDQVEFISSHFLAVLRSIYQLNGGRVGEITMLTDNEKHKMLHEFNKTTREYPDENIVQILGTQATLWPQRTAIEFENFAVSYKQLEQYSNQFARFLGDRKVVPGTIVPVIMPRTHYLPVVVISLFKAGCVYLPIDPDFPTERKLQILKDVQSNAIVVSDSQLTDPWWTPVTDNAIVFNPVTHWSDVGQHSMEPIDIDILPNDLAYIIYTSGSTGVPKGVMIEHGGMMNHLYAKTNDLDFTHDTILAQNASLTFDISIWQMLSALMMGGKVCVYSHDLQLDVKEFLDRIFQDKVSILEVVPSYLRTMMEELELQGKTKTLQYLRFIIVTGEALNTSLVERWFDRFNIPMMNAYGPTEASDDITHMIMHSSPGNGIVPIGRVVQNLQIALVDENLQLCPLGVEGEICVAGRGVGRGYLNQPELTHNQFIQTSVHGLSSSRSYRTGDLGRWLSDGTLEFLGRIDEQVKIRGYRIELGEIENTILKSKHVAACAVVVKKNRNHTVYLASYVAPLGNFDKNEVESFLKSRLPEYMIPTVWVTIESLPLTANGKLDKKALPSIDDIELTNYYVAPSTQVEIRLASVWRDLLRTERIGIDDNLFELGADSISTMLIVSRAKQFGYRLKPRDIFEYPTIREQAVVVSSSAPVSKNKDVSLPVIVNSNRYTPEEFGLPADVTGESFESFMNADESNGKKRRENISAVYTLSPMQEGMLFHGLYSRESKAYTEQFIFHMNDGIDLKSFIVAWDVVLSKHTILRTAFFHHELKYPVQAVYNKVSLPVEEVDYRSIEGNDRTNAIHMLAASDLRRGIDFSVAPLMRLTVVWTGKRSCSLIWTYHHILLDAWSLHIMWAELISTYEAIIRGHDLPVIKEEVFEDYIKYISRNGQQSNDEFWKQYLHGIETGSMLPFVGDNPDRNRGIGNAKDIFLNFDVTATQKINSFVARNRITTSTLVHAIWSYLLYRYTGKKQTVFGVIVSGRPDDLPSSEHRIGLFINIQPLPNIINLEAGISEWLTDLLFKQAQAREYQFTPISIIQKATGIRGEFFDTIVNFQNYPTTPLNEIVSKDTSFKVDDISLRDQTNYLVSITCNPSDEMFVRFNFNEDILDERYVYMMRDHFNNVLLQILDGCNKIGDLRIFSNDQKKSLENLSHGPMVPGNHTAMSMFEKQVQLTPGKQAIWFENQVLTYQELNDQCNRLSRLLLQSGLTHGDRVGVLMERSMWSAVSMIAIMKARLVYVPLDINYPVTRLEYIIHNSKLSKVITIDALTPALESLLSGLKINLNEQELSGFEPANIAIPVEPGDLSYIIYTSGSTGYPKGVEQTHEMLSNLLTWDKERSGLAHGHRHLQYSSFSFDSSLHDIYYALATGGEVHILSDESRHDMWMLRDYIISRKIETLSMPYSALKAFIGSVDSSDLAGHSITEIISTGEQLYISGALRDFMKEYPSVRIFNLYGPSETHVVTGQSYSFYDGDIPHKANIGKPIDNTTVYILDEDGNFCPVGVTGQLYIGGSNLARGYSDNPKETTDNFVKLSSVSADQIFYKTGDLGRWTLEGEIEYLGRIDDQVKIRGYRIELGEIETVILQHPLVRQCVVSVRLDNSGNNELIGYIVPVGTELSQNELTSFIRQQVPDYMIPLHWMIIDQLPLTTNGKIDRKVLPALSLAAGVEYVEPSNETEHILVKIWSDLLDIPSEEISVRANFFEIGGHSLLAARLVSAIRSSFQLTMPVRTLFDFNRVVDLGNYIDLKTASLKDQDLTSELFEL